MLVQQLVDEELDGRRWAHCKRRAVDPKLLLLLIISRNSLHFLSWLLGNQQGVICWIECEICAQALGDRFDLNQRQAAQLTAELLRAAAQGIKSTVSLLFTQKRDPKQIQALT